MEISNKANLTLPELRDLLSLCATNTSPKDISTTMNIHLATVYNWIRRFSLINYDENRLGELLKKRGPKFKNDTARESILFDIIADDASLTQKGMARKLQERNIHLSQPSISLSLKKIKMTRKRLVIISDKKNDEVTIGKRHQFAAKYRRYNNQDLLYLDETGFNLHSKRSYGYSPVNSPARVTCRANKGKNVTLLCLISVNGVVFHKVIQGACNSEILVGFFDDLCAENLLNANNIIMMDNVSFHKTNEVTSFLRRKNLNYAYIPPYSPELNPIEEVFSKLKNCYYDLETPNNFEEIKNNIEHVLSEWKTNSVVFENYYEHMKGFLDKALLRQNF